MEDQGLSPRLNAYRADLADARLKSRVKAARFVTGERCQVSIGIADLRHEPRSEATLDSQLLFGETVLRFEERDGWAWVQNETDGYVGYTPSAGLSGEISTPSHRLAVPRSFLYPRPDLKSPPLQILSLGARLSVIGNENGFSEVVGGWVHSTHLLPDARQSPDYVETACSLLGVPYLWGGRSSLGLDCSALVQVALAAAGIACLRDSDQQEATLGSARPPGSRPSRGDMIFFPDHVAIALDDKQVIHANSHAMLTTIEPLSNVVARSKASTGKGITAIRRP